MNSRLVLILAVVAVVIVGGAIWFLQTQPSIPPVPAGPSPAPSSTITSATPRPIGPTAATQPQRSNPQAAAAPGPSATPAPPRPLADWEIKIDQVLNTKAGETETAQMLINLLPTLPPEGQAEAAQHISNLILDKDYNRVMPMLRNMALAPEVQDVLVTDLMNREDKVKLPALLEVAKMPNHPYHEEALTDLQIFLDQDNGSNWTQWDSAMKEYLRKQAADEAAANATNPAPAPTAQ